MNIVYSGLNWTILLVYLDDTIVYADTFQKHLDNLEKTFKRLRKANLKLNMTKCYFGMKQLLFLGHIVSGKGISTDPAKVEAIKDYPTPASIVEVQRFHGMATYYRKFVKGFATIASPLYQLLRGKQEFFWEEDQQKAFEIIKEKLINAPILAYPDTQAAMDGTRPFKVYTDACKDGLGAHLTQEGEDSME